MRFHLLGTAAGKTVPRPCCRCRVCEHARRAGGRDARTRCAVHLHLRGDDVVEPRYAIDVSPDVSSHLIQHRLALDCLEHLLITHAHADHLDAALLKVRGTILSERGDLPLLHVYGSETVGEVLGSGCERARLVFHPVRPGEPFAAGQLQVTAILAHHGQPGVALHYIVEHGGKRVLLAWDTGWWSAPTWAALECDSFDAVISECTVFGPAAVDKEGSHLTFATLVEMKKRLTAAGAIGTDTPWATLHIGDNGGLTYQEQCALAAPHGVRVGYDGMWLQV